VSRRILSAFLALILVAGFATISKADVTGSFDLNIAMIAMGTQTEAVQFSFDIQANLQVNVTLSGLTVGADIGFGTTGIEFAILNLNTSLGALQVNDQFVFAEPFGCALYTGGGVSNSAAGGPSGQCSGENVVAIGDGDGDGVIDRAVGFVKKRIGLELNIAGITLNNLAIFEDVDFPDIQGGSAHEHDHFDGTLAYDLSGVNSVIDDQTPTFGFGDVITISGQTVSGISVTGRTAFCANGRNYIKKRSFQWEVNAACTAGFGNGSTPLEGGAKTPLLFEREDLIISGVELGGISFDLSTTFIPLQPLSSVLNASFNLLDLADITATLTSTNITNLAFDSLSVSVTSGNLTVSLNDNDGDFQFDGTSSSLSLVLNPNQNPADLTIGLVSGATGLSSASFALGISRGILGLDTTTSFSGDGTGNLDWTGTSFALSVDYGNGFSLSANAGFSPSGIGTVTINMGVTF